MTIAQSLLQEFDQEMATTRRILERVPSDRGEWKPHPKSFAMGHLAQLLAWMPGWIDRTLTATRLDLAKAGGYSFETTENLLKLFDQNVAKSRKALQEFPDSEWDTIWSLTRGDQVLWSAPRGVVVRNHINHLVHHRGQMSVYLRLNDIPVPSMYGPTADERM